jgi:O-antigen biosynthesis protein
MRMNPYGIVILNRYPEYARSLLRSIELHHKNPQETVVVCDRHTEKLASCQIFINEPFVYARNANVGIAYFGPDKDVILLNDDMEVVQDELFPDLQRIAYKYDKTGLLSPLIDGGVGGLFQRFPLDQLWHGIGSAVSSYATVCFPCVYIKRQAIEKVGPLDEGFTGYGFDDDDYCIRMRNAGYWTVISRELHIKHGTGGNTLKRGENWSCSFAREPKRPSNREYFLQKYPHLKGSY